MRQWMKKGLAACLALVMCLSLAACGGTEQETTEETPVVESVTVRVAALIAGTSLLTYTTSPIVLTDAIEALLPTTSPWRPPPTRCPPS